MVFTQSQMQDIQEIVKKTLEGVTADKGFLREIAKSVEVRLQKNFDDLSSKIERLEQKMVVLELQNDALIGENKQLKQELDAAQQYSRRNNIRIFGMKNKVNPENEAIQLFKDKLGVNITTDHIDRCHNVGKGDKQHIIVKFVSYRTRDMVMKQKKKLKGSGVVVTEDLTKARLEILKSAGERFGKQNTWSHDGVILVKRNDQKLRIKSEEQLSAIR